MRCLIWQFGEFGKGDCHQYLLRANSPNLMFTKLSCYNTVCTLTYGTPTWKDSHIAHLKFVPLARGELLNDAVVPIASLAERQRNSNHLISIAEFFSCKTTILLIPSMHTYMYNNIMYCIVENFCQKKSFCPIFPRTCTYSHWRYFLFH